MRQIDSHNTPTRLSSLTLFCKVVDNFGDIGICWRFAKQLQRLHHITTILWVDDLTSFQRICNEVAVDKESQEIEGIQIKSWRDMSGQFVANDITDIVIEFFACDIPPSYITAMSLRTPKPVWLNLEGLTAEDWVEGCHTLPSPHRTLPLTKYFFFPGFTAKTGGLLLETDLLEKRNLFQQNPDAESAFLTTLGVTVTEMASIKVSLFCYPHAPLKALFSAWQKSDDAVTCLIPEGCACEAVHEFFNHHAKKGDCLTKDALTVRIIPFLPQTEYDKLLWACDFNFVRGEDSFVRAQWANRPFIWHIYPQDNNLHHIKLNAFLTRCTAKTDSMTTFSLIWNGVNPHAEELTSAWLSLKADFPILRNLSIDWQEHLLKNGDLTRNLLNFSEKIAKLSLKPPQ